MKGIMGKRLLALLSIAGLAGTVSPATGQVLKGAEPGNQTKAEKHVKYSKNKQESTAAVAQRKDKWKTNADKHKDWATLKRSNNTAEANALKNETAIKGEKNAAGKVKNTQDLSKKAKKSASQTNPTK